MIFSVDNCSLQAWRIVNNVIIDALSTHGQIEIKLKNASLDTEIYKNIRSVQIISNGKEYRAMVTSASSSSFSALTNNLSELPPFLDNQSRLIIYLKDNSIWEIPLSMYEYQYEEHKLFLTIDSKAFNQ
jgi:hypothetical protein